MVSSFLDKTGLAYLWGKITALVGGKQDALTFDSTPTANSTNPVTSAGIKSYVDANAGGDAPVESGTGVGSVQTKAYSESGVTYTQSASGKGAFAEGSSTQAKNTSSHAEGMNTIANGTASHSEGYAVTYKQITLTCTSSYVTTLTYTGSVDSNDVGNYVYCTSFQNGSLQKITAVNTSSNTITIANAPYAKLTNAEAFIIHHGSFGNSTHCEGADTIAVGDYAHSEGYYTVAQGNYSHAEGSYTIANGNSQHVEGKYNVVDNSNQYAHITGIGSASNRKNGFTLDWSGNATFAGKVRASSSTPTEESHLTNKGYVDRVSSPGTLFLVDGEDYGHTGKHLLATEEDGVTFLVEFPFIAPHEQIRYIYSYMDSYNNMYEYPMTKYIEYSGDDTSIPYRVKIVFGNNDATFVDMGESDNLIPESEFEAEE